MRTKGANGVGRFSVDMEIANYVDIIKAQERSLRPDQIRRLTVRGWVDPGAAMLVLPKEVAEELGLPLTGPIRVRYADGRRAQRRRAQGAYIKLLGRDGIFDAIVEPKRDSALIGAFVLEALDLLVDCKEQCLVPRDPSGPVYEIE